MGVNYEADWQAQNEAACAEICRTGNCSTCRTQSLSLSLAVAAHILRRRVAAWARQDCGTHARGILMCKVQHQHQHKSRARPLFAQTQRLKDSFLRFIILYNSPYAVLFIATHAKHCTPPICCAVLRNQLKSYKNTRLFIVAFLFAYLLHVFCKVFQHFLLLAALHQITKMAKAFLLCSAKRIRIRIRVGDWSLGQAMLSFSAIFNLLANGMVSKHTYVYSNISYSI